jgi:hypothetical protein
MVYDDDQGPHDNYDIPPEVLDRRRMQRHAAPEQVHDRTRRAIHNIVKKHKRSAEAFVELKLRELAVTARPGEVRAVLAELRAAQRRG